MIALEETEQGVVIPVRAQPKARKNALLGEHDGRLKVAVTQAPEKGKANAAILKLLAGALGLRRSQMHLLSGETSSQKKYLVAGHTLADVRERLERRLAE